MKNTVLIVDDEPNARNYLKGLVEEHNETTLCGICNSGNEAIKFCSNLKPDIVFLDIQMPGLNGIETAKKLISGNLTSIIIFITAYDQYAIEAFEVEAIGYLLKPFSKEQFLHHLNRAIYQNETIKKAEFRGRMEELFKRYAQSSSEKISEFTVREKGLEIHIKTEAIYYIKSDSEYVTLYTANKKYLKRASLALLSSQLPASFLRIHRSLIINKDNVKDRKYLNNNTWSFSFPDNSKQVSSRSFKEDIERWLSTIS